MWLILLCSVLAGAIFLERAVFFHRCSIRVGEFMRGLANLIRRGNFAEALHECAATHGPVSRVIHSALLRHQAPRSELKDVVQEAGQLEVHRLERRLGTLAALSFVAPMLGLLGTITGLIDAFVSVTTQSGFAGSNEIADGIYQSLLTTAAGIVVAIPCAIGYVYLSSRINALIHDMERAGIEVVNLISEQARQPGLIDFPQATPLLQQAD